MWSTKIKVDFLKLEIEFMLVPTFIYRNPLFSDPNYRSSKEIKSIWNIRISLEDLGKIIWSFSISTGTSIGPRFSWPIRDLTMSPIDHIWLRKHDGVKIIHLLLILYPNWIGATVCIFIKLILTTSWHLSHHWRVNIDFVCFRQYTLDSNWYCVWLY